MTWTPDHPGGRIHCDYPGCTRTRRYYCPPTESDEWGANYKPPGPIRDYCPNHAELENAREGATWT